MSTCGRMEWRRNCKSSVVGMNPWFWACQLTEKWFPWRMRLWCWAFTECTRFTQKSMPWLIGHFWAKSNFPVDRRVCYIITLALWPLRNYVDFGPIFLVLIIPNILSFWFKIRWRNTLNPLLFLSFEHKSRIIHFLAEAREAVIEIFRPLGMGHRQTEGIYGVTILHSLDHYTMGTTLDPMILVDSNCTLPEMCDFVTFTECGFVHETPLLLGSYRLSTLKEECFQSLSKRLIEIDDEFGNQIDFAIVQWWMRMTFFFF